MTRTITILCCLLIALTTAAQKKELNQARTFIKSGKEKDLITAEKLMTGLLNDSANRQNPKIYLTWYEAVELQYQAANEKLYLRQQYDTAQFFSLIRRLHLIAETLDTLDSKQKYRERHAQQMNSLRRNLYAGGTWHVKKEQFDEAYSFFQTYLDAASQPLFKGYDYQLNDTLMPQAGYWATYCAYKLQRPDSVLCYHEWALRDTSKAVYTLQYLCEAYRQMGDTASLVKTLHEGFDRFPTHPYFFPRLADYYTAHQDYQTVLKLTTEALKNDEDNKMFLLARSVAQLNLEQYDDCLATSEHLIALDDDMPEPYLHWATVKLNQALELEKKNQPRLYRKQLTQLYTDARPYMEAYRKLAPADRQHWAPALYRIYLNLNMGKQFEEIDRLLKN